MLASTTRDTQVLTPAEALSSPTLFRSWLRREGSMRFEDPTIPGTCPLAYFLMAVCDVPQASVGCNVASYYMQPGDLGAVRSVVLPRWARTFVALWDLYAGARPGYLTAREARYMARLAGWLRRF